MALGLADPEPRVRTSVDLARPRSAGQILSAALRLYIRYPLLFFILALGVIAPYNLVILAITGNPSTNHLHEGFAVRWTLVVLSSLLVGPLISAFHVRAIAVIRIGGRPQLSGVTLHSLRALPAVVVAELVANLLILLGIIAFIIPGLLLALQWSVVAQSAIMEQRGWHEALSRSRQLTTKHYIHIMGLVAIVWGFAFAVRFGITNISIGNSSSAGSIVLTIIIDTVVASFVALIMALLYFDLLARYDRRHQPRPNHQAEWQSERVL